MKEEFEDRKNIDDYLKRIQTLKEQERFSGIDYQFMLIEEQMIKDFERSISIKHPGDKGSSRENFVRNFLTKSGYLPTKYAISEGSSHIISTTGHTSDQTDLLIYDALNTPKLLSLDNVQFFPVETVYGIIEVKSNLNSKDTVFDALNKIKSFKQLQRSNKSTRNIGGLTIKTDATQGFGIIFAYDSSLKWKTLFEYIEEFQKENSPSVWPNLVVVLNQGTIGQLKEVNQGGIGSISVYSSEEISQLDKVHMFGNPKHHSNLLEFYLILMDLLNNINLPAPPLRKYVNLNRPSGKHTYNFGMMAGFNELRTCEKHGDYLRKVSDESLDKIIETCKDTEMVSWDDVTSLVFKKDKATFNSRKDIKLYNPDNYELEELLLHPENKSLLFDELIINGEKYWIPLYYSVEHKLITDCPKCIDKLKNDDEE